MLHAFRIARYPITNAQYQAFVADGGIRREWQLLDGCRAALEGRVATGPERYGGAFDLPNHPVVSVSVVRGGGVLPLADGAAAQDGRDCTQPGWRRAAAQRGRVGKGGAGTDGRIYPWGNERRSQPGEL